MDKKMSGTNPQREGFSKKNSQGSRRTVGRPRKTPKEKEKRLNNDDRDSIILQRLGESFIGLSNPTRVRIAKHIQKEQKCSFGELQDVFNLNNNTLRHHLDFLVDVNLITQEKRRRPYIITPFGRIMLDVYDLIRNQIIEFLQNSEN